MEFGIEKWVMLIMKSGKREGIEQPNQESERLEKKGILQELGNIGSGHHQTNGDKRKFFKKYLR